MERNENGYSNFNFGRVNREAADNSGPNSTSGGGCRGEGVTPRDANICQYACDTRQLAMVYSPYQCWRKMYSPNEALSKGTLFEELYKPLEEC